MADFVDRVKLYVSAGAGGHGCTSIRREKFKPLAGPDGGNGGRGGSVIARVNPQSTTLLTYHHSPHVKASSGAPGQGDYRDGANGEDYVLVVPQGTVVKDKQGTILADLDNPDSEYTLACGGSGGLGNFALASSKRRAPGFHLLGEPGESLEVFLELKSIADVALVGFPSAGKSSLIAAMSAARPKIADYPFTTLIPNLAVVENEQSRYTIADVPGLIPGAAQGKGLGLEFLRHIERCCVLAHVVDLANLETTREPVADIVALEKELAQYAAGLDAVAGAVSSGLPPLMERQRVIILNKIDMPDAPEFAALAREELDRYGWPIYEVSALTRQGLKELSFGLSQLVDEFRARQEQNAAAEPPVLRPEPRRRGKKEADFTVTPLTLPEGPGFQVRGPRVEKMVVQTDFSNDEAVGYLADRLHQVGVEDALLEAGANPGDPVVIGDVEDGVIFDWEPTMITGAELLGARGTDNRLFERARPSRAERKAAYHEWMDAKTAARAELAQEREAGLWTDPDKE